jgi:metal-responsive CopG/Arc/MetJ family transcriptional regulator
MCYNNKMYTPSRPGISAHGDELIAVVAKFPTEDVRRLDILCKEQYVSRAHFLRQALREFLSRQNKQAAASISAIA